MNLLKGTISLRLQVEDKEYDRDADTHSDGEVIINWFEMRDDCAYNCIEPHTKLHTKLEDLFQQTAHKNITDLLKDCIK